MYVLNARKFGSQSVSVSLYQLLREGLTLEEIVGWEQYLHTGLMVETESGKEKIFRSEKKAILAIQEGEMHWAVNKNFEIYFRERIRKKEYEARISADYMPSMLRWALNKAEQAGENEAWILKRGAVTSLEQPWKNKSCTVVRFINREKLATLFSRKENLCVDDGQPSLPEKPNKSDRKRENSSRDAAYKVIKSVGGSIFWEGGFRTGECPGMTCPSGMPRWFCDLRAEGKIRVNSMSYSSHYLRSDGKFFHVTGCFLNPEPLINAFSDDQNKIDDFVNSVYARGGNPSHSATYDIWECCEYTPDSDCEDLSNFWKVAAAARRTGRFFYASKKKVLKDLLEGSEDEVPWVYAPKFDQFTEDYEVRYRNRIEKRREEMEEDAKRIPKRIYFNFNIEELSICDKVNHFDVLQIEPNSSPREIKIAYWNLARQCHPDLNPGDKEAEEKFKQLSVSYQQLMKGC